MSDKDRQLFDAGELVYLRNEAKVNQIDFARAKIRTAGDGGYVVVFDAPLFNLGNVLIDPPTEVKAPTAAIAEGLMLQGLMKIQRAERYRLRTGRCFGWSPDQINRRPLTAGEVDEYLASVAHAAEVKRLTRELAQVVEANATAASAAQGKTELESRYDLKPAKTKTPALLPSAKPKRAPAKGAQQ